MTDYRVSWEIDVSADTPLHAARLARDIQIKQGLFDGVFDVHDGKESTTVDLLEEADAV